MNVLVTGAKGFIGKNLVSLLRQDKSFTIFEYSRENNHKQLETYCKAADFVFHLAGINRTEDAKEFMEGNYGFTEKLLNTLKKYNNKCPIVVSSSVHATYDTPYGLSKKACEELLENYRRETGVQLYIYRLTNVFGKWCLPNYNSVIATFSYNIARNLPIHIVDKNIILNLVFIDDVVSEFVRHLTSEPMKENDTKFYEITTVYTKSLEEIVETIYLFKNSRKDRNMLNMEDAFISKLYRTYLSYLPEE